MGFVHSSDLRERALGLVRDGATCKEAAAEVGVSKSTVSNWVREADIHPPERGCARCGEAFKPESMRAASCQIYCSPCSSSRAHRKEAPSSNGAPSKTPSSNGHHDDDLPPLDFDWSGLSDEEIELIGRNLPRGVKQKWLARARCEVPDDEAIISRYGGLIAEFYQAMREDPSYLIEMVSHATRIEAMRRFGRNSPEAMAVQEALRQQLPEGSAEWVGRRVAVVASPYT